MTESSCFFTGHRNIPVGELPALKEKLYNTVKKLISDGITDFYAGGAVGFDTLAAITVLKLRKEYSHIKLHIIVPCENQEKKWTPESKELYRKINEAADEVKILSPVYYTGCMQVRNRYMADNSSICIAYLTEPSGGTASTVKYAEKQGKTIINIA
ncbi:MAG: DUF1273 family protein [Clostridia bacterium]|nr:DUF1273 family protein [Clostridia bacterium]